MQRQWDTEKTLVSNPCPVAPTKPSPIFCVDISGDSALPGPGPLSKWYQLCGFYFSYEVFSLSLTWFTFNDSLLKSLH